MIDLSRRSFGFAAGAALFALPKLTFARVPILHGDGIHDDTEALSALFSGQPFKTAGDSFAPLYEDGWAALKGGKYLVTAPIKASARSIYMTRATVRMIDHNGPIFDHSGTLDRGLVSYCHFEVERSAKDIFEDADRRGQLISNYSVADWLHPLTAARYSPSAPMR